MKKYLFAFVFIFSSIVAFSQEESTTYYLIRHAEKVRSDASNKDPHLTKKGHNRASYWAMVFSTVQFDKVFTTKYHRTIQTANPTAKSQGLSMEYYDPRKMYDENFQNATKGKTVLVVGHSNTTPFFANKILGKNTYKEIEDNNNNNLYIITVTKSSKTGVLLKVVY